MGRHRSGALLAIMVCMAFIGHFLLRQAKLLHHLEQSDGLLTQ
nr:hypothetical protein [Verminephrobacter eiseniae]